MWLIHYNDTNGIFSMVNKEAGLHIVLEMEDGMRSEIVGNNPVGYFYSKRHDSSNQVKTVIAIHKETCEMNISIRMDEENFVKQDLLLPKETTSFLFQIVKMYQHQKTVPQFSFKHLIQEE